MSRRDDVMVDKLKCVVSNSTLIEEKRRFFKRFYKDDRVRLRGSLDRTKGTVLRAAVVDDGGLLIQWDKTSERIATVNLHNPRFIETVWADEKGDEI